MTFEIAVKTLGELLKEKEPAKFSSSWIFQHIPSVYQFVRENFRTETGDIDWDVITEPLPRKFSKRWTRYRRKPAKPYEDQSELELVLVKHRSKLYTFIAPQDENDRKIRHRIIVTLVRIAQKGNTLAEQELLEMVSYMTDEWSDKYPQLWKWRGHTDEVRGKIKGCIRCYKYTGSFIGYLFKTLGYSARGIPPEVSLDDHVGTDGARKIDFIRFDDEMGTATLFGR
jgi:hypothetical protein